MDYYEIAAKRDGTILGIKLKLIQDLGAFHQLLTPAIPTLVVLMMPGLYKCQNIRADIVGAFTNCMPTDAYRGAGRPEATHGIERMVDILAAELKMDPAEIRFKNFIGKDEFPFPTATGLNYDSGNYAAPLQKALDTVDYKKLSAEQQDARAQGTLMGIGISTYGEICAFGPSPATPAGGWESATVKIEPGGKVTVMTGCSPHGQGEETTFAQIAADELGVGIDDVLVLHGDTAIVQYGIGTFGSRGTAIGGTAMYFAIQELKEKIKKYGAMLLDSRRRDVRQRRLHVQQDRQERTSVRNRCGILPRHETAAQHGTRPGGHLFLGAAQLHLPLRRAHRSYRSRSRYRRHPDQALRRGGRLREYHESADRGRPGPRRRGARPGTGAVGTGRL